MIPFNIGHISQNRHEWNERRVVELQYEIENQEQKIKETNGFFNKWKEKRILTKMIRRQIQHGEEVMHYEFQNRKNTMR